MAGHAAVGIDDDLAAGQPAVADRATDHEPTGGVDQEASQERALVVELAGEHGSDDVLEKILAQA